MLRIAYLVDQNELVDIPFIRHEIEALERQGVHVLRLALRPASGPSVAPHDQVETSHTIAIRSHGVLGFLCDAGWNLLRHPLAVLRCLARATRFGFRSQQGILHHWLHLANALVLTRRLIAGKIGHLHVHFATNCATVALLCRQLGGPPYSMTIHGPEEFDEPHEFALDQKIAEASFVAVNSSFGRSQALRWCGPEQWSKIHEIRCGVDPDFLTADASPPPISRRMVCVGRLCNQKGQLLLIEAAHRLKQMGLSFELSLVGDGPLRTTIEAAIVEFKLKDRVRITGWLSRNEVRKEIERASALVLPSFAEGLPVVIMEAMALRRPVLTTYLAGIPELVVDGVTGWLIPAGSIESLVEAMRDLVTRDPASLVPMGTQAQERVRRQHNIDNEASKLLSLIRKSAADSVSGERDNGLIKIAARRAKQLSSRGAGSC